MGRDSRITIVDLAPSLLGLASLFLPDKVRDRVRVGLGVGLGSG